MKNILIVGASGMVGSIVLRECLSSSEVTTITSLVRRPSGLNHPKLTEVMHSDFSDLNAVKDHFQGKDVAHFCIGVYTGAVPDAQFREITVDHAIAFGDALNAGSPKATLCFLSGAGADQSETSRMAFARYKGMAENHLLQRHFGGLHIFRPAYIYPVEKREEPSFSYRLTRKLYPLLKTLFPGSVITSEQLGQAIFKAGISSAEKTILENKEIKAFS